MGLFDFFRRKTTDLERSNELTIDDYAQFFSAAGVGYPYVQQSMTGGTTEEIGGDFGGLTNAAYKQNSVVFACMDTRKRVFSEARLAFRKRSSDGKPGDLFSTPALSRLETPWTNGSTGDLLARAISDVDLAGNFYAVRRPDGLGRLRPDWVTIVLGSKQSDGAPGFAPDVEILGYYYKPTNGADPTAFPADAVAHWAPIPDPSANFRGMSWLTPLIREVMADQAAMAHKLKFFDQGATPNLVVKLDPAVDEEAFKKWIAMFRANHEGAANAYRTMFLGGGADATVVGSDLKQIDFTAVQGHGETRIAAAAGVPAIIVGLSEGLASATYSNFAQARRAFSDTTLRFLWRTFAEAMADITDVPARSELWYDASDIPFLREDEKDIAEIQVSQAGAIKSLTEAGFSPDSAVTAIASKDLTLLEHTGLTSVQLLPPGTSANPPMMPQNGNMNGGTAEPRAAAYKRAGFSEEEFKRLEAAELAAHLYADSG